VDHPASPPFSGGRPWRATALVAAAVAAVELVLLVVAAVALFAEPFADEVEKQAAAAAAAEQATADDGKAETRKTTAKAAAKAPLAPPPLPKPTIPEARLPRSATGVLVLNGNGRQGAAAAAAGVVHGLRYVVTATANAPRMDFGRSVVMYRPGFKGEAHRLAKDLRIAQVTPLDGLKPAELGDAELVLVVGG
jgi:hypothetical protein